MGSFSKIFREYILFSSSGFPKEKNEKSSETDSPLKNKKKKTRIKLFIFL